MSRTRVTCSLLIFAAARLLRGHIRGGAHDCARRRRRRRRRQRPGRLAALVVFDALCQPEIEQLHETSVHDLEVRRLQIAVNDPLAVSGLEGICNLHRDRQCVLNVEGAL